MKFSAALGKDRFICCLVVDVLKQTKQFRCQSCFISVDLLSCRFIDGILLEGFQFLICDLFF